MVGTAASVVAAAAVAAVVAIVAVAVDVVARARDTHHPLRRERHHVLRGQAGRLASSSHG